MSNPNLTLPTTNYMLQNYRDGRDERLSRLSGAPPAPRNTLTGHLQDGRGRYALGLLQRRHPLSHHAPHFDVALLQVPHPDLLHVLGGPGMP